MKSTSKTAYFAKVAMLGVLAYLVMFIEFALPFFPSFLKLDLSDLVPLIGSLALGPVAGLLIELLKNLLHLLTTHTGGVGELANFIVGSAFVCTAGIIYQHNKTRLGAVIALACSVLAMIVSGALVNYFITVPLYAIVLGLSTESIVGMSSAVIPAIHDKLTLILFAFCPFNLLKGIVLTLITMPLYKRVSPMLKRENLRGGKKEAKV
ncbi:MAG: ECF transporter S component [Oscillospiraceae bacterium]|nr:ECF transporter S component [Oscillospiraceae bacterium]